MKAIDLKNKVSVVVGGTDVSAGAAASSSALAQAVNTIENTKQRPIRMANLAKRPLLNSIVGLFMTDSPFGPASAANTADDFQARP